MRTSPVLIGLLAAFLLGLPAYGQTPTPRPQPPRIGGPIGHGLDVIQGQGGDNQPASGGGTVTVGNQKFELTDALIAKVLPDLTYATALAHQNNNVITAPCFDAVLALVNGWNAPIKGPDGQPLTMPDPHVLVTLERASELLHQLQPDSTVSVGCGALGQALQKDIATVIGTMLSGGALGLFKLPIVPLP